MMDKILNYIALRDTLAPEGSPVLSPDRSEEIKMVAKAAIYIFTGKFPEFFRIPVIPEAAEPDNDLPEETRAFVKMMMDEFVASYTLNMLYAATDPAYAAHHRQRAADVVESLTALAAPISMLG